MLPFLIVLFLILAFALLIMFLGGRLLIKRRTPNPPDHPSNYGMTAEDVQFPSRYKVMLRGWWIPAEQARGTIIFSHGQNGSMEGDLPQAAALHRAGYNLLLFNMRAHGTSEGEQVTFGVFEKEDLLGAIDYVTAQKGVEKVALLGFSMGAGVAMIAAALSDRVSVLVLDGAYLRLIDAVQRGIAERLPNAIAAILANLFILGATLLTNTRMFQVSPMLWARHLPNIPVLFIHSENDSFARLDEIERLAADLKGPYEIWVAPDCRHREAFLKHEAEYIRRILNWLEKG